ncbi:MAG: serine/threonine-protein kinase [Waterburya sp.]
MKGNLIQNKYYILQTLGQDTFGETFLARDKSWFFRRRCIIKKFRPILGNPKVDQMRRWFDQEASTLKRLRGKNRQIPRIYEHFMDGEDFYLVREWIDGLTLKQKVQQQGKLPTAEVEQILDSVLSCLKYIHSYGIVYRQLKPSSIILRQSRKGYLPVPIYFGGVKELETKINQPNQRNLALANQQEYVPPEQEQGKSVYASDLYSLGLTAIYLLTGKTPAEFPVDPQTQRLLWHEEISDRRNHLIRVLDRAICPDISERFTSAEAMLQALHSPLVNISLPVIDNPPRKSSWTPEIKIFLALSSFGVGVIGIAFLLLNVDFTQLAKNDFEKSADESARVYKKSMIAPTSDSIYKESAIAPTSDSIRKESATAPTSELLPGKISIDASRILASPIGNPRSQITDFLGEPTLESRGYWQNSKALLYRDVIPNQVALGYLTDIETTNIRQAEITFAGSVDLLSIKQAAQQLLQEQYSAEIDHYINQIYFKTSNLQEFKVNNLKGVVQRNPQEHIYLGIWDSEFH